MVMRSIFSRLLGQRPPGDMAQATAVHDLEVAVAALLLYVGTADFVLTSEERANIAALMAEHYGLPPEAVEEILAEAGRELKNQIDIYAFTTRLNASLDMVEKVQVIEMIWQVIFADNVLHGHEDQVAHRLARILHLDHSQLIEAKLRVKRQMQGNRPID